MAKENKESEEENKCGPGTHYDADTNSCVLGEDEDEDEDKEE